MFKYEQKIKLPYTKSHSIRVCIEHFESYGYGIMGDVKKVVVLGVHTTYVHNCVQTTTFYWDFFRIEFLDM